MSVPADSVTLVTGGGSGIGAALCQRLAAPGRTLFVHTGSRRARAEEVCENLRKKGAMAFSLVMNFTENPTGGVDLIEQVRARCGRLDQLVHAAGFADRRPFGELDDAGLSAALDTNLRSFFHLATTALPLLRASPAGRVVSVGSFVAEVFRLDRDFLFPATAASKGGLLALTKALAAQLAPDGVTVNCVAPGFIQKEAGAHTSATEETRKRAIDLVPLRRRGQPDEVAAAIAFLLSADAGYITGQCIHVHGGITL